MDFKRIVSPQMKVHCLWDNHHDLGLGVQTGLGKSP